MLLHPKRIVRVTTEQELNTALELSVDQVIVEGDDRLLSYAVAKASKDAQNRVAVEFGERSVSVGRDIESRAGSSYEVHVTDFPQPKPESPYDTQGSSFGGSLSSTRASPMVVPTARPRRSKVIFIVALVAGGTLAVSGYLIFRSEQIGLPRAPVLPVEPTPAPFAPTVKPSQPQPPPGLEPAPDQPPPIDQPPRSEPAPSVEPATPRPPSLAPPSPHPEGSSGPGSFAAILQMLAWPTVSVVAIAALFFIARQAIAGGRNVEISWKVTEKVTGRVVITKVETRVTKQRKAA